LNGSGTWLLLEDGIVAQALALRLLAIAASWVEFVALNSSLSAGQTTRLGSALDLLLVAATAHHA
jgi:hypothetical protein